MLIGLLVSLPDYAVYCAVHLIKFQYPVHISYPSILKGCSHIKRLPTRVWSGFVGAASGGTEEVLFETVVYGDVLVVLQPCFWL